MTCGSILLKGGSDMSENIKEIVAKNLLYYRKKNKITQKQLADKLGVKHNAISA